MRAIESDLKRHGLKPQFFHGSGGSVERGGGSVQEQIEWWPKSALQKVKITIQGEMVQRTLASPEIFKRQLEIFDSRAEKKGAARKDSYEMSQDFAEFASEIYRRTIHDPDFLKILNEATLYPYLKYLK